MSEKIKYWAEELALFDDDLDKYQYLIDLAKNSQPLPPDLCTDTNLVTGCISKIWVDAGLQQDKLKVYYNSDAIITKGITHLVCDCFSDIPLAEAKKLQKSDFAELGLDQILTGNRRNGLSSLIDTIIEKVELLQ
jgi:cysteine desulfuration protein SufE